MRTFARLAAVVILSSAWGCGSSTSDPGDLNLDPDGGADDATSGDGFGGDVTPTDGGSDGFVLPDSGGCKPKTCSDLGTNCGPVADGCGGIISSCGTCSAPEFCGGAGASKCGVGDAACTPKTCGDLGATCGKQGDGCGGLIDCGTCSSPATCGGGGVLNTCGIASPDGGGPCTPKTCAAMGYNCGPTADGCGGLALCGTCTVAGETCGGGGSPNVCGSSVPVCTKKTCADWGANCGPVADGCGGLTASCGTCTGADTCGGGGVSSVCGGAPPVCTPKTCADFPGTCGPQPDGCGGLTAVCGTCTPPATCGGGGVASVCGGGAPPCTPKTCTDFPGKCGALSDGCGGLTAVCGTCTPPSFCGGGGTPSVCGGGTACVPKTCATAPAGTCGKISDGCGGLTADCGGCTSPAFCGGGGASLCGVTGGTSCVNLACKQVACTPATKTTSISGTVYDPAGLHPLPNVNVYVPNTPVLAITTGATCDACSSGLTGTPLVKTVTDVNGKFKLDNMPVDTNVPVVIQLGKWRRQIKITTNKCADTVVPAGLSRFPRNKAEGDIPKIALTTGNADPLECLLRKIGIDDAEFTNPTGTGRVNLFVSTVNGGGTSKYSAALGGAAFPNATQLWNQVDPSPGPPAVYGLRAYDVVLLGCEGTPTTGNKTAAAIKAMEDYTNVGGRVFSEHYHYQWMLSGTTIDAPSTKAWSSLVTWTPTTNPPDPSQETVLRTFPKAITMSDWMQSPGIAAATTTPLPSRFPVSSPRHSIGSIKDTTNVLLWVQTVTGSIPQYFTFDTPVAPATGGSCGRFVFSDIHVSSGDTSNAANFPGGCTTAKTSMTPQELALEFMFFDLASPVCGGSVPPPTCTPTTCAAQSIDCGAAPDGCGATLDCGVCAAPLVCSTGGKCAGSSCTPATCGSLGFTCGSWADGCGGVLSCGTCSGSTTCGGGGVTGKCGGASCTPTTCSALGHDCGTWADGCGGTLTCGTCTAPATCGGGGVAGSCGGTTCTPKTCTGLGYTCGSWADGCGGVLACGPCTAPDTCGGGGVTGACGSTGCTPKTCTALGISCGPAGDGCGGSIDCGPCPDSGSSCVPLTCGGRCGLQGDGCGGILTCPACDGGSCVPTTCLAAGAECGSYPDGCGGLLTCGSCLAPATCGGSGTPNKCGGVK